MLIFRHVENEEVCDPRLQAKRARARMVLLSLAALETPRRPARRSSAVGSQRMSRVREESVQLRGALLFVPDRTDDGVAEEEPGEDEGQCARFHGAAQRRASTRGAPRVRSRVRVLWGEARGVSRHRPRSRGWGRAPTRALGREESIARTGHVSVAREERLPRGLSNPLRQLQLGEESRGMPARKRTS